MEKERPVIFSIPSAVKKIEKGHAESLHIKMQGMYDIEKELEELGYEHDPGDGDNTNGWEVDFWYRFVHPEKGTLVVSGGIWQHGSTYIIYKDEEETTEEDIDKEAGSIEGEETGKI